MSLPQWSQQQYPYPATSHWHSAPSAPTWSMEDCRPCKASGYYEDGERCRACDGWGALLLNVDSGVVERVGIPLRDEDPS